MIVRELYLIFIEQSCEKFIYYLIHLSINNQNFSIKFIIYNAKQKFVHG